MDYVKIGDKVWDVLVTEIREGFSILYSSNSGRTMSKKARMTLDPLGTFYDYKVTFQRKKGKEAEYDRFFDYVSTPRYDGIPVEIVHNQTTLSFDAYISQGERMLKRIDLTTGKVFWDKLSLSIVPMEAQVSPDE